MPKPILIILIYFLSLSSCYKDKFENSNNDLKINSVSNENYTKANTYLSEGKMDSSFTYFDLASDDFIVEGDSMKAATCFIQMAITLYDEGDYYGSQETSLEADKFLNSLNAKHSALLAFNYNNLGNAISSYGDNETAIDYYDLAIKYAKDSVDVKTYENNKAVTLYAASRFKDALIIHEKNLRSQQKNNQNYARVLSNYANTRWRIDHKYNPLFDLHKSLQIRLDIDDKLGLNSSYAHLFEYHYLHNLDSAKVYARKSFDLTNNINVSQDRINALEKMIKVSKGDSTIHYFRQYKLLDDSVRRARLKAKNQFALIRYEAEKTKINNLKLEKDVVDRDLQMSKERISMVAFIGIFLCVLIFYVLWNIRRRQQIKMEAENKVNEIRLKTSKKVHDVVANGIYSVMTELEYAIDYDKEELLDKLEIMYEKSRDISYDDSIVFVEDTYVNDMSSLLKSFANDLVKILIVGNDSATWMNISQLIKSDVLIIVQELLVNMRKHSQANEVIFRFEKEADILHVFYKDNGIGSTKINKIGNGLRNTGNRIESLNGTIKFVSDEGNGFKVDIYIPISKI